MAVVDVQHIRKSYIVKKGFQRTIIPALRGVSFSVKKGQIFGLIGPNGAGKTTMINILAGIVKKDAGSVKLFEKESSDEARQRMNVATAYNPLMSELTVEQNLNVYAAIYGVKKRKERILSLLHMFRMESVKDKRYYLLSSGQKTRVNICKGLINNPELLLLDEATVGLDPDIAQRTREQIRDLNTTIILTSHYMKDIEELCDRAAFLHHGKIIRAGTPKTLTRLIRDQIVEIDVYPTQKNIIKLLTSCIIIKQRGFHFRLRVPHADRELHNVLHPLLKAGIKIRDMHIHKPSLEDVFLRLTRP